MFPGSGHRCCSGAEPVDRPLHFLANSLLKSRLMECATGTICLCFGLFALIHSLYLAAEFPSCGGRQVFAGPWGSSWGRWHHVPNSLGPGRVPEAAWKQWSMRGSWQGCLLLWSLTDQSDVLLQCGLAYCPLSTFSAKDSNSESWQQRWRAKPWTPVLFFPPCLLQTTNWVSRIQYRCKLWEAWKDKRGNYPVISHENTSFKVESLSEKGSGDIWQICGALTPLWTVG